MLWDPGGLLQSFADMAKFLFKEPIIPSGSNKILFLLARFDNCVYYACCMGCGADWRRLAG